MKPVKVSYTSTTTADSIITKPPKGKLSIFFGDKRCTYMLNDRGEVAIYKRSNWLMRIKERLFKL